MNRRVRVDSRKAPCRLRNPGDATARKRRGAASADPAKKVVTPGGRRRPMLLSESLSKPAATCRAANCAPTKSPRRVALLKFKVRHLSSKRTRGSAAVLHAPPPRAAPPLRRAPRIARSLLRTPVMMGSGYRIGAVVPAPVRLRYAHVSWKSFKQIV
ncbi:hypothetical protein EVAR_20190_1 [Eumeta japonica]|uniref:Uncharacterized protein n=1 Tax=Eumeta variegata TaxID=151549 RepID=A0A4C1UTR9_EUMVA|nr:hypothetical protein EVAR_20190_1 [Eumeta japonica]